MDEVKIPEQPEKETIEARAAKKREELRNGRRNTQTAENSVGHAEPGDSSLGRNIQILRGEGRGAESSDRRNNGTQGSLGEKLVGIGQPDRRPGDDNQRANGDVQSATAARRVIGRLEADGPIPDRLPDVPESVEVKRGRGRPRKEETPGQEKKGFFGIGSGATKEKGVLSRAEAERIKDPFIAALKDDAKYADEFLWWYSKDESQPQIWSDMDNEEIETLASVLLKRAERSPATATFVRNVVDGADYISTAMIVVPRMIKSVQQVNKRPKQARKEKAKRA